MNKQIDVNKQTQLTTNNSLARYNLLGMTLEQLIDFFALIGEKPFRAEQAMKWIHHFGVTDFSKMSNFGKKLQIKLMETAIIMPPKVISLSRADDGVVKWLIRTNSGSVIESIYIPHEGRSTLCVSSQAGCILDCSFCSTGKQGFDSNLTSAEIIGQVFIANQHFNTVPAHINRSVTNIVLMGMGEPLLNFGNVINAARIMMHDLGYGISKRKVTLSTAGVVPQIYELSKYVDLSLAISLHAPNDELRNELVPLNKKYNLQSVLDACNHYISTLGEKRVLTVEYILLAGVNDLPEHAKQLVNILKNTPCKINLIPFNPYPASKYKKPKPIAIMKFRERLQQAGFNVTVRTTRGEKIYAACGQLAGNIQDKTKRQEKYKQSLIRTQMIS